MKQITVSVIVCLSVISCSISFGQYPYQQNTGSGSLFYPGYVSNSAYGTMRLGDAAMINAQANYVLSTSEAAMNYEAAYTMHLQNKLTRTQTYFENRQLNMYYRDLEEWQREERKALKRAGLYDRTAIEYLYGRRR